MSENENNVINLEKKAREGYKIIKLSKFARAMLLELFNSVNQKLPGSLMRKSNDFDKEISVGIEDFEIGFNKDVVLPPDQGKLEEIVKVFQENKPENIQADQILKILQSITPVTKKNYIGDVEAIKLLKENEMKEVIPCEIHKKLFDHLKAEFSKPEFTIMSVFKIIYAEIMEAFEVE